MIVVFQFIHRIYFLISVSLQQIFENIQIEICICMYKFAARSAEQSVVEEVGGHFIIFRHQLRGRGGQKN